MPRNPTLRPPRRPQDQKGEVMSNKPEAFVPVVGDWIMWNHSDGLRIGEVRFRRKKDHYTWRYESVTSLGVIADERVLELRKASR